MNNGGLENVKENGSRKNNNHKKLVSVCRNDEFVNGVVKVAVAQICESIGFQGFQSSALATLSDIAVRYVRDIGKCASSSANLAGRSECNVFDVLHGLEDLSSNQGFSGESSVGRCLLASGAVKEVVRFVGGTEEIPFAYAVPEFPVVRKRKLENSFVDKGEDPPPMLANETGDGTRVKKVIESNPFLVPPLPFEEKEVSQVVHPTKLLEGGEVRHQNGNHLSALEEFALVAEAFEGRASQEDVQNVASNRNPHFRLTLRRCRKYSYKAIKMQNEDTEKITHWFNFNSDSEEDEKKTRAQIMDGIENQQELNSDSKEDEKKTRAEIVDRIESQQELNSDSEEDEKTREEIMDGLENQQD
ncbi:hypothetical protein Leryth_012835 [Lithospermum erythrorhizon]|nr:hypothetical protein Leryth_012835 [Lithospermum erythrorhizon]